MSTAEIHIIYHSKFILSNEHVSLFGLPECLHSCCCFSLSLSLLIPLLAGIPVAGRACSKYVTECNAGTLGIMISGWGLHNGGTCAWCASESSDSMTDRQCELATSRSQGRGLWNIIKAKTSSAPSKQGTNTTTYNQGIYTECLLLYQMALIKSTGMRIDPWRSQW